VKVRDEANIGFTTLALDRSASGLQQLNLHACSFTSRYKMHRGHIFTIEALRVPERGDQTKDHNIRKLLALIIALDLTPNSVGQIDNDWFGSAPHDDPLQGKSIRRNDFLVGKPRWNIEEIAGCKVASNSTGGRKSRSARTPRSCVAHRDGAGGRFNKKDATPHGRVDAGLPMNGCETL
jgi:hypothetical protein